MITKISGPTSRLLSVKSIVVMVLMAIFISGCGGGGSSTTAPVPNQDASGLFRLGTGTIGGVNITELNAFVHNSRIIAFSIPNKILIDGTINSITSNTYDATVNVYVNGAVDQTNVNVTGMVTTGSSITGTLNGTGNGSGNFSITFDLLYNRGATAARITTGFASDKQGVIVTVVDGASTSNFDSFDGAVYDYQSVSITPSIVSCNHDGIISIPLPTVNIYTLQETIAKPLSLSCDASLLATDYTGFAAVVDGVGTDDTFLYAVTNSTHSVFAVLTP